jgi:putative transposase
MRYIGMNPVRAALVDDPAHYRWTSYRANALGQFTLLLSPHPVYLVLRAADHARRVAYRSLSWPQLDPETISDLRLALIP